MSTSAAGVLAPDVVLVPIPAPAVEYVETRGEVVVWRQADESLHLLDGPTSLVFLLADGTTTLGRTLKEICSIHGDDPALIELTVLRAAAALVERGLVEISA